MILVGFAVFGYAGARGLMFCSGRLILSLPEIGETNPSRSLL